MQSESSDTVPEEKPTIVFKKRRCVGNRRTAVPTYENDDIDICSDGPNKSNLKEGNDDDEEPSVDWETLNALRELQKSKKRGNKGINILDLNSETKVVVEKKEDKVMGGLTDSKSLINELDLGNTFSLETNRRDEDAELMKYVEEELNKRRPKQNEESTTTSSGNKLNLTDEMLLRVIPEHLLKPTGDFKDKSEEMLSSQMLSGIPEIDLGIDERIRNIETTETARTKLLEEKLKQEYERMSQENKDMSFAPKNLASCYVRNNMSSSNTSTNHRFNLNSVANENKDLISHFTNKDRRSNNNFNNRQQPQQHYDIEPVVVIGDEPQKIRLLKPTDKDKRIPGKDKPSDDYIFEKFKKHIRRH